MSGRHPGWLRQAGWLAGRLRTLRGQPDNPEIPGTLILAQTYVFSCVLIYAFAKAICKTNAFYAFWNGWYFLRIIISPK